MLAASPACSAGASSGAAGASLAAALQFVAAAQCLIREPWPPAATVSNGTCFDFIVVGGGTAGSTLAARLAELCDDVTVLLVEAGPDPPQEAIIPGLRNTLKASKFDWNFTTINDFYSSQSLRLGIQKQPRGKMLGGSGSLNDMVYARGFPDDYHDWAQYGDRWNWTTVLEYFKKSEHMTDENIVDDPELMAWHGSAGAIEVTGKHTATFETERYLEAFKELSFNIVKDMTYPNQIGAGRFSHTIRDGQRDSSLTALLNKAVKGNNLFVLKETVATKILIDNGTAYGVQVVSDEEHLHFYANLEVILSAGTFNTPKLLMLSGIGPRDHLEELGIEVIQDLPVGDNLHDHVMVLKFITAENGTCYKNEVTSHIETIKYFIDNSGALSYSDSMGAYLALNQLDPNVPDFAFYPSCVPINAGLYQGCSNILGFENKICSKLDSENKNHEIISVAVVLLKPKSRGNVRLHSSNPLDYPIIYSGTFNDEHDLKDYPEAVRVVHSLAETSYFKSKQAKVVEFNIEECKDMEGDKKLSCEAMSMASSAWHAVGTASLGAVVDGELNVMGVTDLRVVDASVMPRVVRGNTNAPVIMIAEQAADIIKAKYKR